ncbi:MAG: DUF4255 domain-containing protein [bacterium]|nr:DUF4255 domain-containing protein [bacterium]
MSDFRAIAGVTSALQQFLDGPASAAVPGATVRAGPPSSDPVAGAAGMVNIFLYQVTPNPSWRNAELPVRREDGTLVRRPQAALDLHYLLSFFGEETKMVPQLLLGATISALHAQPTLTRQDIPRELAGKSLLDSGLREQAELLQFVPMPMTYDEISRLWSIFQVPYSLSVAYRCQVVLIEADLDPEPALPTRKNRLTISLGWPAQIDKVVPQVLEVAAGARLKLEGRHLAADGLSIRVGGNEISARPVSEHVVEIDVPPTLAAGVHTVRPVRVEAPRAVSNPASFVLLPKIVGPVEVAEVAATDAEGNGEPSMVLRAPVMPKVAPEEPVALVLHELPVPEDRAPRRYSLRPSERTETTDRLEFPAPRVAPGEYLVRVEVNRVVSLLSVGKDPESPDFDRYNGPRVSIP